MPAPDRAATPEERAEAAQVLLRCAGEEDTHALWVERWGYSAIRAEEARNRATALRRVAAELAQGGEG